MMVHINPKVSFGFPSTISSARILTNLIFLYRRKFKQVCKQKKTNNNLIYDSSVGEIKGEQCAHVS